MTPREAEGRGRLASRAFLQLLLLMPIVFRIPLRSLTGGGGG